MECAQNILNSAYRATIANSMLKFEPKIIDISIIYASAAYGMGGH
jgi:hypothetical protein